MNAETLRKSKTRKLLTQGYIGRVVAARQVKAEVEREEKTRGHKLKTEDANNIREAFTDECDTIVTAQVHREDDLRYLRGRIALFAAYRQQRSRELLQQPDASVPTNFLGDSGVPAGVQEG